MNLTAKAPGKLILIGEYAVLEGAASLVMAVNRYARIDFQPSADARFHLCSPPLKVSDLPFTLGADGRIHFFSEPEFSLKKQLAFFINTLEQLAVSETGLRKLKPDKITLETGDFYLQGSGQKLGLGSSAALTVALLYGFLYRLDPSHPHLSHPHRIYQTAQEIHSQVQGGRGSGIDIAASSYGGVLFFRIEKSGEYVSSQVDPITAPADLQIIPVWSGQSASTPGLVEKVTAYKNTHPESYRRIINHLSDLSQNACEAFRRGDSAVFMDNCNQYCQAMEELGEQSDTDIVSAPHRKIAAIIRNAGGVYKPSGAGGGDIGLAFTRTSSVTQKVIEKLWHSGFQTLNLDISKRGVFVEKIPVNSGE